MEKDYSKYLSRCFLNRRVYERKGWSRVSVAEREIITPRRNKRTLGLFLLLSGDSEKRSEYVGRLEERIVYFRNIYQLFEKKPQKDETWTREPLLSEIFEIYACFSKYVCLSRAHAAELAR